MAEVNHEKRIDTMTQLPIETQMEVLSRLPIKSLMRFKCISKHWFSLITDPFFIDSYNTRSHAQKDGVSLLLHVPGLWYHRLLIIEQNWNPESYVAVQEQYLAHTCLTSNVVNGLICFCHFHRYNNENAWISVYNLTTRESLYIPPIPKVDLRIEYQNTELNLGFDPVNKVYKLLVLHKRFPTYPPGVDRDQVIIFNPTLYHVECHAFTIGYKYAKWRKLDVSNIIDFNPKFCMTKWPSESGFCHDGVLYWSRKHPQSKAKGIITFNVEHERFKIVDCPYEQMPAAGITPIKLQGHLSFVAIQSHNTSNSADIVLWSLVDSNDNNTEPLWTKSVITTCSFPSCEREVCCCSDIGLLYSMRHSKSDIVTIDCYDIATGRYTELNVDNTKRILSSGCEFRPSIMVENIMPLKSHHRLNNYKGIGLVSRLY